LEVSLKLFEKGDLLLNVIRSVDVDKYKTSVHDRYI